ncbi:MAG TPA: lytic murein transglycosylase [Candidatus Limnocylindria bacterium]|nr:lytic murein transglycosylase [Candidatus Limnocylindria bacterium]
MTVMRAGAVLLAAATLAACARPTAGQAPSATPTVRYTPIPTASPTPLPPQATATVFVPDLRKLPEAANDAPGLARQLVVVERAIRDPNISDEQLKWYGHLQQLIISRLNDFPEWKEPVVNALPAEYQEPLRQTMEGGRQLRLMGGSPAKALPEWKILSPAPSAELLRFYREAQAEFGVPWEILASINLIESRMGRIQGLSSAGAMGPMQFMPATWAAYGKGDPYDPRDSIMSAARYLVAAGARQDIKRGIFAYNHSGPYVNAVLAYAEALRLDPNVLRGYYGWQVYYWLEEGPMLLPEGWKRS